MLMEKYRDIEMLIGRGEFSLIDNIMEIQMGGGTPNWNDRLWEEG